MRDSNALTLLNEEIIACRRCPRLNKHCSEVARLKRRAYLEWDYWGKPAPSFGDVNATLLILGLAPGAHGANRTGRLFTGDRSGDLLYRVLHSTGFATQPNSVSRQDGMRLTGAYISATVHCAPPDNKPTPEELRNCRGYLEREIDLLPRLRVIVALGRIAFDTYLSILRERGSIRSRSAFAFGHGEEYRTGPGMPILVSSYHPSQQNTSTGKLTEKMFRDVFLRARRIANRVTDAELGSS